MSRKTLEKDLRAQLMWHNIWESILIIAFSISGWFVATNVFEVHAETAALAVGIGSTIVSIIFAFSRTSFSMKPLKVLEQAIDHVSSQNTDSPAPDLSSEKLGKDYLTSLISDIYSLSANSGINEKTGSETSVIDDLFKLVPMPILAVNAEFVITYANLATHSYLGNPAEQLIGKSFNEVFNLWFTDEMTLEKWQKHVSTHSVTATNSWERVKIRLGQADKDVKLADMIVSYNRSNQSGFEYVIGLFDHSEKYGHDEQDIGYVAMAVHELRTPITILRGYLEALDEELGKVVNQEQQQFIKNMNASAQQLSSFVSNILNIARIEENQFELHLSEATWPDILTQAVKDLQLRASVRNKTISLTIEGSVPTVAVDRVSILEVINNIVENAIKYGGNSASIEIDSRLKDGYIETTVQDHGEGIPTSNVSQVFNKFYRSHHTRSGVSGTGLGLYISKKIIDAHNGQIWFKTKEGEGSLFGFSLMPFTAYQIQQTTSHDKSDAKQIDGWIQNHSLYRK